MLKLTLFGAPTVILADQTITGALSGKLLALFLYLAVTAVKGGPPHRREAVADLFWSELPSSQRRSNLRYLLADLRRLMGDYLIITPQTVCFNRQAAYWMDVDVVYTTLRRAAHTITPAETQAARALYQGEFLAGFRVRNAPGFAQWVIEQRQELHALISQAPAAAQPPKTNLPNQFTPFFGREAEISAITRQLTQDNYRLLTLIGEGGVGKTRLALAVAQKILDFRFWILDSSIVASSDDLKSKIQNPKFPDGIWFVPLAELKDTPDLPEQLATAIAKALDFSLSGQGAPTVQICHYLTQKQMLLILDNFEQLTVHTAFLLALLQQCNGVRLLVTSRRRLNVQAEYPWRLTGLPLPPLEQAAEPAPTALLPYAGVALFAERARRADPHFQLDSTNQAAVVAICHLLAGLPLGIELAAALCQAYTCAALLAALQVDYAVLNIELADLPARQRSINLVLDHSWRLLTRADADLLAACAVFQGGFTSSAAAVVTGATGNALQRLVDHSLLRANRIETTGWRYDLHELVQHYAREQLALTPTRHQQVLAQHAAYYLGQLQRPTPWHGSDAATQAAVQRDFANISAAWRWSIAEQRLELLAQGVEGLAHFYTVMGPLEEGLQMLQAALVVVRQPRMPTPFQQPLLMALLSNASELCIYLALLDEAEVLAQEALTIGQASANGTILSWAYDKLARVAQRRNQHALMYNVAEQAYHLAHTSQDASLQAICSNTLGVATLLCGDVAKSLHWYHEALAHLGHVHDARLEARLHNNMAHVYKRLWDHNKASYHLGQGLTLAQHLNDYHSMAVNAAISGELWLTVGAFDSAQNALTQATQLLQEIHDPYWEAGVRTLRARLLHLRGDYTASVQECQRVLARTAGRFSRFEHQALTYYGDVYWASGDPLTAEQLYQRALVLQTVAKLDYCLAEPAIRLAELQRRRGAYSAALTLLEQPLALLQQQGPVGVADPFGVYLISYRVFKAMYDPQADRMLEQAYHLFQTTLAKITDAPLRHSFLTNIPWRRELWALVQAHFGAT